MKFMIYLTAFFVISACLIDTYSWAQAGDTRSVSCKEVDKSGGLIELRLNPELRNNSHIHVFQLFSKELGAKEPVAKFEPIAVRCEFSKVSSAIFSCFNDHLNLRIYTELRETKATATHGTWKMASEIILFNQDIRKNVSPLGEPITFPASRCK